MGELLVRLNRSHEVLATSKHCITILVFGEERWKSVVIILLFVLYLKILDISQCSSYLCQSGLAFFFLKASFLFYVVFQSFLFRLVNYWVSSWLQGQRQLKHFISWCFETSVFQRHWFNLVHKQDRIGCLSCRSLFFLIPSVLFY